LYEWKSRERPWIIKQFISLTHPWALGGKGCPFALRAVIRIQPNGEIYGRGLGTIFEHGERERIVVVVEMARF
jgi:hypothetical protein